MNALKMYLGDQCKKQGLNLLLTNGFIERWKLQHSSLFTFQERETFLKILKQKRKKMKVRGLPHQSLGGGKSPSPINFCRVVNTPLKKVVHSNISTKKFGVSCLDPVR